jgi:hypothetical protein
VLAKNRKKRGTELQNNKNTNVSHQRSLKSQPIKTSEIKLVQSDTSARAFNPWDVMTGTLPAENICQRLVAPNAQK